MNQWSKYYDMSSVNADVYITEQGSVCIDYTPEDVALTILIKEDGSVTFIQDGIISKDSIPLVQFGRLREAVAADMERNYD